MSQGLTDAARALQRLSAQMGGRLPGSAEERLHDAAIEGFRRVEEKIPRDTGALRASLLRRTDRAHVWTAQGDQFGLGSTLPQAQFQADRLPEPDPAPIEEAVAAVLDKLLAGVAR